MDRRHPDNLYEVCVNFPEIFQNSSGKVERRLKPSNARFNPWSKSSVTLRNSVHRPLATLRCPGRGGDRSNFTALAEAQALKPEAEEQP